MDAALLDECVNMCLTGRAKCPDRNPIFCPLDGGVKKVVAPYKYGDNCGSLSKSNSTELYKN